MDADASRFVQGELRKLEAEVAQVADVERVVGPAGSVLVRVTSRNPTARSMSWTCLDDEIVLEVGAYGGRWELTRSPSDVSFMVDVVRSVLAGRVRETFGRKRSRVEVTLADGTSVVETGSASLVPTPGWRRRGQPIHYSPYRPAETQ